MFPGEALGVALCELLGKLIDGQTPEQREKIWDQWISFWAPLVKAAMPHQ